MLSVIIPANNEADYVGPCLEALLAQSIAEPVEIVVAANACTDATVAVAGGFAGRAAARGWRLEVLDIAEGGKPNALNRGDAVATGDMRLYLDADVICSPALLAQIRAVLDRPGPVYASGKFVVTPPGSWVTRHYAALWTRLPFMTTGVPGGGLFAVNDAGRARWGRFPDVIADDSFVRLQFTPIERVGVSAEYVTPLAEGFWPLVRVRRRWEAGSRQLAEIYPHLLRNDDKPQMRWTDHVRLFRERPVSYLIYAAIRLAVRLDGRLDGRARLGAWQRGR